MTDDGVIRKIEEVLEQIRPNIQMDGGDVKFIKFDDGVVHIALLGACVGCISAIDTVKTSVEEALKDQIGDVREVIIVEDNDEIH